MIRSKRKKKILESESPTKKQKPELIIAAQSISPPENNQTPTSIDHTTTQFQPSQPPQEPEVTQPDIPHSQNKQESQLLHPIPEEPSPSPTQNNVLILVPPQHENLVLETPPTSENTTTSSPNENQFILIESTPDFTSPPTYPTQADHDVPEEQTDNPYPKIAEFVEKFAAKAGIYRREAYDSLCPNAISSIWEGCRQIANDWIDQNVVVG